ncbi:MAG: hypothetical protein A3J38_04705 [Gammaproteobacteria bacterium RIFCSPHIGHO2_12_FULL_45_9]|nr:MAG: hypothetical protein A3J38_04705 [Gammaproteobacteria bacterium RIFCSPHIGHO2_12_FULL_45_9]
MLKTLVILAYLTGHPLGNPNAPPAFVLTSHAFPDHSSIPTEYTCIGANRTPTFSWHGVPRGTRSLAFIVYDDDAPGGDFYHWGVYNIPPAWTQLTDTITPPATVAPNSWGNMTYQGPCPPKGPGHHYHFRLYALNTILNPKAITDSLSLRKQVTQHALGMTEWVGQFEISHIEKRETTVA